MCDVTCRYTVERPTSKWSASKVTKILMALVSNNQEVCMIQTIAANCSMIFIDYRK